MPAQKPKLQSDEQGFASLIIAIVLILILSLITVGFAQLMQREQGQALNKQLSSQAYYAAESGINDATRAINAGYFQAVPANPPKNTCGPITTGPGATYFGSNTVGSSTNASYTCLTVNPTPPNLQYGSIGTTTSKVVEIEGIDGSGTVTPISKLEISWQDAGTSQQFVTDCSSYYPAAAVSGTTWGATGILRAELVPISDLSRTGLTANAYTGFFCPLKDNSTEDVGTSDYSSNLGNEAGTEVDGDCNPLNPSNSPSGGTIPKTPLYCNAEITGLTQSTYYLILRSVYSPVAVTVTAYSTTSQLNLTGAQTIVDSTGKAQDVLRRIQVRIPTTNNYDDANFDLESAGSICKQLDLTPTSNDGPTCPNTY